MFSILSSDEHHSMPTPDVGAPVVTADRPGGLDPQTVPYLAHGLTWEDQPVGFTFRTGARTMTESDLVAFVDMTGFVGPTFLDSRRAAESGYSGRVVPGMMTLVVAEGLVLQTNVLFGTGIAFLSLAMAVVAPVHVGDTIEAVVAVVESRPTSKPGRGIVTTDVTVFNQRGEVVLTYSPTRMQRGRSSTDGSGRGPVMADR
jgi:acyl dehydratase